MDNHTRDFLGLEYSWSKASIKLEDIQPLHGGVRVYLPGWTMSQMFVTQVSLGGQETKYRIPLEWQKNEKEALCQLFIEQDFLTIQPEERPGIPDEARPTIMLTNSKNENHTVAKWAGVADERFDLLYQTLLSLADRTKTHKPIPAKFKLWQKALILSGLVVILALTLIVAYGLAAVVTMFWWPEHVVLLLGLLVLLLIGAVMMVRWQIWREWKKSRQDRLFSNSPAALIVWVLFFVAFIGCGEILWAGLKTLWSDALFITNDNVEHYATLAYSALFGLYFVSLEVALLGSRFLDLMDERF